MFYLCYFSQYGFQSFPSWVIFLFNFHQSVSQRQICFFITFFVRIVFRSSRKHAPSSLGLAHIGARAAFSFACAFLRRAWRSGEDSDLCREFLQEALEALQCLPECSLFDESSVSPVWIDTVDRVSTFLKAIVSG